MAKKRRKKKRKRIHQRGPPHRRSLLDSNYRFQKYTLAKNLRERRERENEHIRRVSEMRPERRYKRLYRKEARAMRLRFTPGIIARAKEIRNFMESKERWICAKRASRREGLFGSGSIGKNKVVSKLRRMTIDSLVDCRRR